MCPQFDPGRYHRHKNERLAVEETVSRFFFTVNSHATTFEMIHDKASIAAGLLENTGSFAAHFSEKNLLAKPENWAAAAPAPGKWSPLQHLDHLVISVKTINRYLKWLPKWVFRWRFGKLNRPARNFEETLARYHSKLRAMPNNPFSSGEIPADRKVALLRDFEMGHAEFIRHFSKWSENELDETLVPHPLLGKITVREMLFFVVFHVRHHERIVEKT